jgi:hypothetical protein
MSDISFEIGQLSQMNMELNKETLDTLRGNKGKYAQRLGEVATRTFRRSNLLSGTTTGGPSVLAYGMKNRLQVTQVADRFSMYVREMPTPHGRLVMFPLHTIGLTVEGTPIIDPKVEGSYSVLHTPKTNSHHPYNPADMKADMAFTVDADNLVTVNGQNTATIQELVLFDRIVTELESRAEII